RLAMRANACGSMSLSASEAPHRARARAHPDPILPPAPVTMTPFPARSTVKSGMVLHSFRHTASKSLCCYDTWCTGEVEHKLWSRRHSRHAMARRLTPYGDTATVAVGHTVTQCGESI